MTMLAQYAVQYSILAFMVLLVLAGTLGMFHKRRKIQLIVSSALLVLIAVSALYFLETGAGFSYLGALYVYPFSMLFVALFSVGLLFVNLISYVHSNDYIGFSMLLGFVSAGVFFVAMAGSLITILLGIELMAVPTSFMILFEGKRHLESAVKLFVLTAVSIAMLAFAITLIFPYSQQLALAPYAANGSISGDYIIMLALFLFVAGLSFDASIFPFNLWVPDVYQGAPANVTALLAGINKKVAFVALFEVLFIVMIPVAGTFSPLFQTLAILTMLFGNLAALVQDNVKRLFAYSSISQAGYIAIGIATASQYGIAASIFQIFAHTFAIIGTFAIILWLDERNVRSLKEYEGLAERSPLMAFALTVFMLSMIGIPPLAGFVGKFLLFSSAISSGMLVLAFVGILTSIISVYYYARVIFSMYAKRGKEPMVPDWAVAAVACACLVFIVAVGIYPQPLVSVATAAAQSLHAI